MPKAPVSFPSQEAPETTTFCPGELASIDCRKSSTGPRRALLHFTRGGAKGGDGLGVGGGGGNPKQEGTSGSPLSLPGWDSQDKEGRRGPTLSGVSFDARRIMHLWCDGQTAGSGPPPLSAPTTHWPSKPWVPPGTNEPNFRPRRVVERIRGKVGPMGAGSTAEPGRWDAAGRGPGLGPPGEGGAGRGGGWRSSEGRGGPRGAPCSSGGSQKARALVGAVMTFYF